jgi:hypothetical protein
MDIKTTFSGLGPKEAEFVARLTYEKKSIVSAADIDGFLPPGFKYRNQLVYTLKQHPSNQFPLASGSTKS